MIAPEPRAHDEDDGLLVSARRGFTLRLLEVRQAAHNGSVVTLLRTLDAQVRASAPRRTPEVADTFTVAFAEHRAITEAVRSQDAEAARGAMLAHHGHDVVGESP